MRTIVDLEHFRSALAAVSLALWPDDPGRLYARFLLLDVATDAIDIVACNGHWIAVWREPILAGPRVTYQPGAEPTAAPVAAADSARMLVRSEDLAELRAWLKARGKRGAVEIDTAGAFTSQQQTHTITPGACAYPPYREVLHAAATPSAVTKPHAITLAGEYVATIMRAFKLADERPIMFFGGCDDAVWIKSMHGSLTCVLMTVNRHRGAHDAA